jgi:hypothetical protein
MENKMWHETEGGGAALKLKSRELFDHGCTCRNIQSALTRRLLKHGYCCYHGSAAGEVLDMECRGSHLPMLFCPFSMWRPKSQSCFMGFTLVL